MPVEGKPIGTPNMSMKIDLRAILNFAEGQFIVGCHSCGVSIEVDLTIMNDMAMEPLMFITEHLISCGKPINV